jgi:hypothetical protein
LRWSANLGAAQSRTSTMYPSHDMNPIAIEHMRRERLEADIRFIDRTDQLQSGLLARLRRIFREKGVSRGIGGVHGTSLGDDRMP